MISSGLQLKICDVCRLLDYSTEKKLCNYCGLCDAWICQEDQPKWTRRFKAWAKRKLESNYHGVPNYEEIAGKGITNAESRSDSGAVDQRTSSTTHPEG